MTIEKLNVGQTYWNKRMKEISKIIKITPGRNGGFDRILVYDKKGGTYLENRINLEKIPEEGEKQHTERKVTRVSHTFDDGVAEYIEGEDLKLWEEAMDSALMLSFTHHNNVQEKLKKVKWKEVIL